MNVIDHGPQVWFLIRDGDALLLDARCSHGAADYSWLIELNAAERAAHASRGHAYVDELAQAIHESAPGVLGNRSPYRDRKVGPERAAAAHESIMNWVRAGRT